MPGVVWFTDAESHVRSLVNGFCYRMLCVLFLRGAREGTQHVVRFLAQKVLLVVNYYLNWRLRSERFKNIRTVAVYLNWRHV